MLMLVKINLSNNTSKLMKILLLKFLNHSKWLAVKPKLKTYTLILIKLKVKNSKKTKLNLVFKIKVF